MKNKQLLLLLLCLTMLFGGATFAGKVGNNMSERDFLIKSYSPQYCDEIAFAYGDGLMSAGGTASIEELVAGVELKGKRVLDFGSGLGGMAYFLAEKHRACVVGVDINQDMLARAQKNTPTSLKKNVSFALIDESGVLPFADSSIDVVCSKEVILHLSPAARAQTFKEFFRILKPGGVVRIMDWVSPHSGRWGSGIEQMMEVEDLILYAQTKAEYAALLAQAGLTDVTFTDQTSTHVKYNRETIAYLREQKTKAAFLAAFGQQEYDDQIEGYEGIAHSLSAGEVVIGTFCAYKPVVVAS